jgi:SAM-dependent methyltransferase
MGAEAFGQSGGLTVVDRLGVYLSARQLRRSVPSWAGKRVGDFGCGYRAAFARTIVGEVAELVLVDVALSDDFKRLDGPYGGKVRAVEGALPDALGGLADGSLDVIMCISVLEHLSDPLALLRESRRLLAPGGVCLLNVPSWRGKGYLEFSAFRLGMSPADGVDDHKMYYDPRDLWPLLVRAGFMPSQIRCFSHKFGLNTFAECRR